MYEISAVFFAASQIASSFYASKRVFSSQTSVFLPRAGGIKEDTDSVYLLCFAYPSRPFFFYFYVFLYRSRPSCDVKWPLLSFYIEHKQIAATLPFRKMETRERTLYFYVVVQNHEACETSARLLHVTKRFYPALNAFTRH